MTFLKLLKHQFLKGNQLNSKFNPDTVKKCYCCMKNIGSIIFSHNKQILQPDDDRFECNCRVKRQCPLENKCLTPNIVYEPTITNNFNDDQKKYLGVSETPFKERFRRYTRDFKHKKHEKCTEISDIFGV